jgi:hypothetical protein
LAFLGDNDMRRTLGIAVVLAVIVVVAVIAAMSGRDDPRRGPHSMTDRSGKGSPLDVGPLDNRHQATADPGAAKIQALCSTCHVLPTPDVEPKGLWPDKIRQMYGYAQGPRPVPENRIPPMEETIEYWTARAPEFLLVPDDAMGSPRSPQAFKRHMITLDVIPGPPSVSSVKFVRLSGQDPTQLLVCDMRHGLVVLWTPSQSGDSATVIGHVAHPSHTHVVDLDGDGRRDILVANLGDYWPVDTTEGSVVWLRNRDKGQFESVVLLDGLGRVNDIQTADFDDDGDLDLVVAVFGNLTTGMIVYLENCTQDYSQPDFDPIPLDYRTGTSDVPVVDLNQDGHPDFIALLSQENEHVVAFLNRGWGSFSTETVYRAPHPRWGSTGILLIDLDGDGDMDVLFNHGDSVQIPPFPRPYHGFGWLENRGSYPFTYHRLAHLPGAHTSLPADLDGDGDLDLVSSVFIPAFDPKWPNAGLLDTVIWLQQTTRGQYRRYSLETRTPFHPCADLGDFDGDGDVDIVLGNFSMFPSEDNTREACITVLENSLVLAPGP